MFTHAWPGKCPPSPAHVRDLSPIADQKPPGICRPGLRCHSSRTLRRARGAALQRASRILNTGSPGGSISRRWHRTCMGQPYDDVCDRAGRPGLDLDGQWMRYNECQRRTAFAAGELEAGCGAGVSLPEVSARDDRTLTGAVRSHGKQHARRESSSKGSQRG